MGLALYKSMETTVKPVIEVKPLSPGIDWAYDDLRPDFHAQGEKLILRQVSKDFYWEQLEIMPPMYCKRGISREGDKYKYVISGFGMCEFMSGEATTVHFDVHICPVGINKEEARELYFSTIVNWGMHMEVMKELEEYIKTLISQ
jgi:hypothetical protein